RRRSLVVAVPPAAVAYRNPVCRAPIGSEPGREGVAPVVVAAQPAYGARCPLSNLGREAIPTGPPAASARWHRVACVFHGKSFPPGAMSCQRQFRKKCPAIGVICFPHRVQLHPKGGGSGAQPPATL